MLRYAKGARCERELLNTLHSMSYSVIRSAGSGVNSISPDVVAIKNGKGLAFECKAWEKSSLSIEAEKYEALREWEKNSGMQTFIAWRMSGESWFFIKLDEMKKTPKNYTVGKKLAFSINRKLESIIC